MPLFFYIPQRTKVAVAYFHVDIVFRRQDIEQEENWPFDRIAHSTETMEVSLDDAHTGIPAFIELRIWSFVRRNLRKKHAFVRGWKEHLIEDGSITRPRLFHVK